MGAAFPKLRFPGNQVPVLAVTAGGATFRYDESMQRYREPTGDPVQPMGWIPLGRDVALEQQMLDQLAERLGK